MKLRNIIGKYILMPIMGYGIKQGSWINKIDCHLFAYMSTTRKQRKNQYFDYYTYFYKWATYHTPNALRQSNIGIIKCHIINKLRFN